jgi:sulfoxide reductase heme-binding subunit YedZ
LHLTSSPLDWYAARAAGVVAYVLLSAVVLLGLTIAGKRRLARWPQFALEDVHRFGGLLVGAFVCIHIATIAVDSWLPFSPLALTVPLVSRYRPVWVALGIVAAELLLALAVTNHYRARLPYLFWRRAHYLNFAVWAAATLHGLGSGTDRSAPWLLAIYAVAVSGVTLAIAWRVTKKLRLPLRVGVLAPAAAAGLVVLLATGPLHFRPRPWNARSFRDTLVGQIVRNNGITRGIVSLAGHGVGRQNVLVRADLLLAPRRTLATDFRMEYLPSGELCNGTVIAVHAVGFEAKCRMRDASVRYVHAAWELSASPDVQGGVLSVHS